ncbi:hypothetical protein PV757_47940, partial [Streptomyces europaeiscabiei]|nr:hypothetical protein [Streptomyces europaeiscabiei]
ARCSYSSRSGPAPAPPVTATYPQRYQPDQALLGLAHVAIAARAYPTAGDLEEESIKRISLTDVDDFLRRLTAKLREAAVDADGLPVPHGACRKPWRKPRRWIFCEECKPTGQTWCDLLCSLT